MAAGGDTGYAEAGDTPTDSSLIALNAATAAGESGGRGRAALDDSVTMGAGDSSVVVYVVGFKGGSGGSIDMTGETLELTLQYTVNGTAETDSSP